MQNEDIGVILAATLTLLALIIGFSFSMATNRYDQRKNFEEGEANAIGTAVLRADLLPPSDAAKLRKLLRLYLDQRIQFYTNEDEARRAEISQTTSQLQADLWAAIRGPAGEQPTPVTALVISGINDVINSQGYTQAAFWNSISPCRLAAHGSHCAMLAIFCSAIARERLPAASKLALVLPFVISIALLLIADIDAPRHGLIRSLVPQNLESLAKSLGSLKAAAKRENVGELKKRAHLHRQRTLQLRRSLICVLTSARHAVMARLLTGCIHYDEERSRDVHI